MYDKKKRQGDFGLTLHPILIGVDVGGSGVIETVALKAKEFVAKVALRGGEGLRFDSTPGSHRRRPMAGVSLMPWHSRRKNASQR